MEYAAATPTTPSDTCDYGLFTDMEQPSDPPRPPCCSPRPPCRSPRPPCCSPRPRGAAALVCTHYSHAAKAHRADQDFALAWEKAAVICDGHGQSRVINLLRQPQPFWADVAAKEEPIKHLQGLVGGLEGETINEGSTVTLLRGRVDEPAVECWWLGDSPVVAYERGQRVWESDTHTTHSASHLAAARRRGATALSPQACFKAIGPHVFTEGALRYLSLGGMPASAFPERLAMTRALGHMRFDAHGALHSVLDPEPGYAKIRLAPGSEKKFVLGSDGFWDMFTSEDDAWLARPDVTADLLLARAEERLAQKWAYHAPGDPEPGAREHLLRPEGNDDVAVAVWTARG